MISYLKNELLKEYISHDRYEFKHNNYATEKGQFIVYKTTMSLITAKY